MAQHEYERPADTSAMYSFSLGALLFMLGKLLTILEELGDDDGMALAEEARHKAEQAQMLQYDWEKQEQGDPLALRGGRELDAKIDDTLGSLSDSVRSYAEIETDSELTRLANELVEDLFPNGVFHITSKPYESQHATVSQLTGRMRDDYAEHIEELRLEPIVSRLEELNAEFGELLDSAGDDVQYDEVQQAKVEAEDKFHMLIGHLLCTYGDERETFQRVMAPINEQSRRTRRQIQRRGSIPPVDPESGEPVEPDREDENPTDGPGGQNDGGQNDGGQNGAGPNDGQNDGGQTTDDSETGDGESETDGNS
jgi:hypothetical protein